MLFSIISRKESGKYVDKTFDRYASIVFLALGIAVFVYIQNIEISTAGSSIGPKELPAFLALVLIVLSVANLLVTIRSKESSKQEKRLEYKKFLTIFGSLLLYALLIETIGYVISTFLFLMVGFQTIEKGGYLKSALIAAAFAGGVYYLYVEVALGVLPPMPF